MSEASMEFVFQRHPEKDARGLGSRALESARRMTAEVLGTPVEEVTELDIAEQYSERGFNEWPADVAAEVRDVLAEEFGFTHL